jgi:hypothetical protein
LALASWGARADDKAAKELALEIFVKLHEEARTTDLTRLRMSRESNAAHSVGNWCHGVAGYLWCMLHSFGDDARLIKEIDWAANVLQEAATVGTPTYCHGLAGQLELWRMLEEVPRWRAVAATYAAKAVRALRALHHRVDNLAVWCSDDPAITTPDLWIGFLGPATALALHAARVNGALLSSRWLRSCANFGRKQSRDQGSIDFTPCRSTPAALGTG